MLIKNLIIHKIVIFNQFNHNNIYAYVLSNFYDISKLQIEKFTHIHLK